MHLLNNSILVSYVRNFFLDKLAFNCDILRKFAIGGLTLNKRITTYNLIIDYGKNKEMVLLDICTYASDIYYRFSPISKLLLLRK